MPSFLGYGKGRTNASARRGRNLQPFEFLRRDPARRQGRAYVQLTQGQTKNGMINSATMFATLIIGLIAGPAVSL
jgi:hypothetical protein